MVFYGFMCTILWAVFPPSFFPFHIFPPCLCPQRGVKFSSRDVGPILRNFGGGVGPRHPKWVIPVMYGISPVI